ncbi:thiamine phosphate synthase [Sulfurimonas sp. SAG-AH-194-I05]|nr:thiamine phosphate synthase [Sulfurimonas sp. SAG-AH-194-I05]MDF1876132.1 thiamine phosphate synthase [Sulfurimonas sp. SAG-AH-194-I05]
MRKYLITSPESYPTLKKQLQTHMPEYVLYRDKEHPNYNKEAKNFMLTCGKFKNIKTFLHQNVVLAKKVGANGVHLTSQQFNEISHAKSLNLEVIISTHSYKEVLQAQSMGADAVTYSPIFHTPNKGEPKGIKDLENLLEKCSIKIFALGGIVTPSHVQRLETTSVYGFASIRYFV